MTDAMPMALEGGFDPRSDVFNRLLKNRVAAPRYVMLSEAFRDLLDDDHGPLVEATEHPDGFEPLRVFVRAPAQAPAAGLKVIATPFMQ